MIWNRSERTVYLGLPPPVSSFHIMVYSLTLVRACIAMFRGIFEVRGKLRVAVQGFNALEDVAMIEFKAFTSYNNMIQRKARAGW